jgi:hypothetical protein
MGVIENCLAWRAVRDIEGLFKVRIYLPNTEKQPKIATHIQPLRPTMRFSLFFLLLLIPASSQAAEQKRPVPNIPPPALVLCKTDATCDRDPKHLEAFVTGFYKWYLALEPRRRSTHNGNPSDAEQQTEIDKIGSEEEQTMSKALTPRFHRWVGSLFQDKEPQPDPRYCSIDSNPFFCGQDWMDEWADTATARLVSIDKEKAIVHAILPWPESPDTPSTEVTLKVTKGAWRIDAIRDAVR